MAELYKEFLNVMQEILEYRKMLSVKHYLLGILVILIMLVLGLSLVDFFIIAVLGVLASYSTIYKRYIRVPSSVELVTLGTFVTAIAYGPLIGALFGIITTLTSELISAAFDMNTLFYMVSRAIAAVVVYFLYASGAGLGVVWLGLIMLFVFNLISMPIYLLGGDPEIRIKALYFIVTNTVWNIIIFILAGDVLLDIAL